MLKIPTKLHELPSTHRAAIAVFDYLWKLGFDVDCIKIGVVGDARAHARGVTRKFLGVGLYRDARAEGSPVFSYDCGDVDADPAKVREAHDLLDVAIKLWNAADAEARTEYVEGAGVDKASLVAALLFATQRAGLAMPEPIPIDN